MRHVRALAVIFGTLAVRSSVVVAGAAAPAAADVGHCTIVQGEASFSPSLDLSFDATTVVLSSLGTGCVEVELSDPEGDLVEVNSVEIEGTFTGQGSTLVSNYSGSGTITWNTAGSGSIVDEFDAICFLGAVGVCPFVGTVTDSTAEYRAGSIVEMAPQTLTINPLDTYPSITYTELAMTTVDPTLLIIG